MNRLTLEKNGIANLYRQEDASKGHPDDEIPGEEFDTDSEREEPVGDDCDHELTFLRAQNEMM